MQKQSKPAQRKPQPVASNANIECGYDQAKSAPMHHWQMLDQQDYVGNAGAGQYSASTSQQKALPFQPLPGYAATHARLPSSDQTAAAPPMQPSMEQRQAASGTAEVSDTGASGQYLDEQAVHETDAENVSNALSAADLQKDARYDVTKQPEGNSAAAPYAADGSGAVTSVEQSEDAQVPAAFAQHDGVTAAPGGSDLKTPENSAVNAQQEETDVQSMALADTTAELQREIEALSKEHEISLPQQVENWHISGASVGESDMQSASVPLSHREFDPSPLAYRSSAASQQLVRCFASVRCLLVCGACPCRSCCAPSWHNRTSNKQFAVHFLCCFAGAPGIC